MAGELSREEVTEPDIVVGSREPPRVAVPTILQ